MKNRPLKGGGSCKYMPVIMLKFTHRRKRKFFIWQKIKRENKRTTVYGTKWIYMYVCSTTKNRLEIYFEFS